MCPVRTSCVASSVAAYRGWKIDVTYKSRLTTDNGLVGRFLLTLFKLSLKLMGMRDEPGMVGKYLLK